MTLRQLVVLAAIADNEGASQTTLVNVTGVDRSTLADMIRRLLKKGLVARRRTKDDARAYAVKLTTEGARTLNAARDVATSAEKALAATLAVTDRTHLLRMLKSLGS